MFRNYLEIARRNLVKKKTYFFIVAGVAFIISAALLSTLTAQEHRSTENFIETTSELSSGLWTIGFLFWKN